MAAKESKLRVFAHLGPDWAPCGQLLMTEEGSNVLASSFAYGLNSARRVDAREVDPESLSLRDRAEVLGKRLLPANGLPLFGGIRDAGGSHTLEYLMDAAERVQAGLPIPAHLDAIFVDGTALGGARPKASLAGRSQAHAHPSL